MFKIKSKFFAVSSIQKHCSKSQTDVIFFGLLHFGRSRNEGTAMQFKKRFPVDKNDERPKYVELESAIVRY